MNQLNPQQLEAVHYLDGPLLVLAGAGSGKTGVITHKICYLIREHYIPAERIYAITFTNKTAREMQSRLSEMLSTRERKGLHVSTFHTLGLNILRREIDNSPLRRGFSILDQRDGISLLKDLSQQSDEAYIRELQARISLWKNNRLSPENALAYAEDEQSAYAAVLYQHYQERLHSYNLADFDDLLLLPQNIFAAHADSRCRWQENIAHLLIDEYQDTNDCQYQLLRFLVGDEHAFTAVGDDDQSIYAWRGAKPENMLNLSEDYPTLKIIKLEQNYRSEQSILNAGNALISHNQHLSEKKLWSNIKDGEGVHVLETANEDSEVGRIVSDILVHQLRGQTAYRDYAILYRSNFQSRAFEQKLREHSIPYQISGGSSFFEQIEIRDLLCYLRLIVNPADDNAFLRICNIPRREIGSVTLEKLCTLASAQSLSLSQACLQYSLFQQLGAAQYRALNQFGEWLQDMRHAAENTPPAVLLRQIVADIDYEAWLNQHYPEPRRLEKRLEQINELYAWLERLQKNHENLGDLLQHIALMDILQRQEQERDSDAVRLMTLHAAKGLEFPYVYIVGVEEGLLPHVNSSSEAQIAEERRLLYVGITRAQRRLTLSYARKRRRGGEMQAVERSRFFQELPQQGINWQTSQDRPKAEDRAAAQKRKEQFFADLKALIKD